MELAGLSARAAAAELNRRKIESALGGAWSSQTEIMLRARLTALDQAKGNSLLS
jgi:hypothetical protein